MSNELSVYKEKLKDFNFRFGQWALYGTGKGAEKIYAALQELKAGHAVKYVIERDESPRIGGDFHQIPIVTLSDICDCIDGILVAAQIHSQVIIERIMATLTPLQSEKIRVIDIFHYNTVQETQEYVKDIEQKLLRTSKEFVAFTEHAYAAQTGDTKIIAWYLPQFHTMEINNRFHGQGFTEWTNTSRTMPMFTGHYQPHIPYDVGYYDLLNPETFKRQIFLAKRYGIFGFCFHYYWFSGKRIMEKPLELFLEHTEWDMPFCLDWATENWTALWDGGNNHVMMQQDLCEEDDFRFMQDILPYMKDPRYIKIDGRPVLVIYRATVFSRERFVQLLQNFRQIARSEGFADLYIMLTTAFEFYEEVQEWGADAIVEYPPFSLFSQLETYRPAYLNPYFRGSIQEASSYIKEKRYMIKHKNKAYFRSALTSWDNTARKGRSGCAVICGLNPNTFKSWLSDIMRESHKIHSESEDIVFVNSWNEWAEGSHLEPDWKYGYGYLQAVQDALEEVREKD